MHVFGFALLNPTYGYVQRFTAGKVNVGWVEAPRAEAQRGGTLYVLGFAVLNPTYGRNPAYGLLLQYVGAGCEAQRRVAA